VGDTAQIMSVRELALSESCKRCVSFELRYGMCADFFSNASSTSPNADRDLRTSIGDNHTGKQWARQQACLSVRCAKKRLGSVAAFTAGAKQHALVDSTRLGQPVLDHQALLHALRAREVHQVQLAMDVTVHRRAAPDTNEWTRQPHNTARGVRSVNASKTAKDNANPRMQNPIQKPSIFESKPQRGDV
jgi:hypothetical protein